MKYDYTDMPTAQLLRERVDLRGERRRVNTELTTVVRRLGVLASRRHDIDERLRAIKYAQEK